MPAGGAAAAGVVSLVAFVYSLVSSLVPPFCVVCLSTGWVQATLFGCIGYQAADLCWFLAPGLPYAVYLFMQFPFFFFSKSVQYFGDVCVYSNNSRQSALSLLSSSTPFLFSVSVCARPLRKNEGSSRYVGALIK